MGATDARDLVFAHLGIASPPNGGPPHPVVDYGSSLYEVFAFVASYILGSSSAGLDTLLDFLEDAGQVRPQDLSSWIPDWRSPRSSGAGRLDSDQLAKRIQRRDEFGLNRRYPAVVSGPSPLLLTVGYTFDTIEMLGPMAPFDWEVGENLKSHRDGYQQILGELLNFMHGPTRYTERMDVPRRVGEIPCWIHGCSKGFLAVTKACEA